MAIYRPFFIPEKEVDFMDALNEELLDDVLGQYVDIYKISTEETQPNVYGEASTKYFTKGFRVNCLISFEEPEMLQDEFGPDLDVKLELYFHRNTLKDENFYPEVGDIVDWNEFYFEIDSVTEPQLIGGHQSFKHQIKATAHRSRISSLQIEERSK